MQKGKEILLVDYLITVEWDWPLEPHILKTLKQLAFFSFKVTISFL